MSDQQLVVRLRRWFDDYARSFITGDADLTACVRLKMAHTERVCREVVDLGLQLGLSEAELVLAEIMALLHDVGRFEQLARHHTLSDSCSLDHAELGVAVLEEQGVLAGVRQRDRVLRVIALHNCRRLPPDEDPTTDLFARLLRDADKLDIWHVVTTYYHGEVDYPRSFMALGLPDTPGFSSRVVEEMLDRRVVDMRHVQSLNDLKLLQLGWIYDVNFALTLAAVRERRYLERLRAALPEAEAVDAIFAEISAHLRAFAERQQ
jgi:hypothetical protein